MKDIFLKIFILIAGVSVSFISSASRANLTQADLTQYANANVCQGPQNQTVTNACSKTKKECVADFSSCMATASTNGTCSMASDGTIQCTGILLCQSTNDDGDCVDWGYQDYNQVFHFCAATAKNDFSSKLDDSCKTVCGDGIVGGDEVCDGSLSKNGLLFFPQKCSKDCKLISTCGNGIKEGDETCDDGNPNNGGHNGEPNGYCNITCNGTSPAPFPSGADICGDNKVTGKEICDDGPMNGSPTLCNKTCDGFVPPAGPHCGDGTVNGDEECDDGNQDNTDGCNTSCMIVPTKLVKFSCYGPAHYQCVQAKMKCQQQGNNNCPDMYKGCLQKAEDLCTHCGDGKVDENEDCDDGADNGPDKQCGYTCGFQPTQDVDQGCWSPKSPQCYQQKDECSKNNGGDCPEKLHQCLVDLSNACPLHIASAVNKVDSGSDASAPVCSQHKIFGCNTMGCSFIPGTATSGSVGPWLIFALGLLPMAGRRWKKGNR